MASIALRAEHAWRARDLAALLALRDATRDPTYRAVVRETIRWLLADLRALEARMAEEEDDA